MDTTIWLYILTGMLGVLVVTSIVLATGLNRITKDIQQFKSIHNHNGTAFDFRLTAIQEYLHKQHNGSDNTKSPKLH
jgi:hypothetical protein